MPNCASLHSLLKNGKIHYNLTLNYKSNLSKKNVLSDINQKPSKKFRQDEDEEEAPKEPEKPYRREPKIVEPFKVICSREKLLKLDSDPLKPPPFGTYNPKVNKVSNKVWRDYETEMKILKGKQSFTSSKKHISRYRPTSASTGTLKTRPYTAGGKIEVGVHHGT